MEPYDYGSGVYDPASRPESFDVDMPASRVRLNINLDLTSTCNIECIQCWMNLVRQQGFRFRNDVMPLEVFRKILSQLDGQIERLCMSCAYEPFVNRRLHDYLDLLPQHPPQSTNMISNAMLIRQEDVDKLIDVGFSRLTLSIDGATKASFEKIRKGARWEKFLEVLEMIRATKSRRGAAHPTLRFNWTTMKSTIPELPGLVRMAAEHGVGEIFFLPLYQYEDLDLRDEAIYWDEREEIHAAVAETQALADRLGVVLSNPPSVSVKPPSRLRLWFQDLDPPRRDRPLCEQPWSIMRVSPNGAIHPCDGWFVDGVMGNWATQSWEEIWNGPAYTRLRRAHWRRAQPFECCKVCSGYAPNRYKEMRPHPHALDTADLIGRGWFTGIELAKSSRRNRTDGKEPGGNGR